MTSPNPATVSPTADPIPKPDGKGISIQLWQDVSMMVYPEHRGTYEVEIMRGTGRIHMSCFKSPPWLSSYNQNQLIAGLTTSLGEDARSHEVMQKKIRAAFDEINRRLESDDGTRQALTSTVVRTVMERTERVTVYPANEEGQYEVVISGKVLTFTTAQMAQRSPSGSGGFNQKWLTQFPTEEIDATKTDWKAVKAYWLEIAEVREVEEATEAEDVIYRLLEELQPVSLVTDAASMTGPEFAWYDERNGVVWVHSRRIGTFLENLKLPGWNAARLSTTLKTAEITLGNTRLQRIGINARKDGKQVRCWPFKPGLVEFRQPTTDHLEARDLVQL